MYSIRRSLKGVAAMFLIAGGFAMPAFAGWHTSPPDQVFGVQTKADHKNARLSRPRVKLDWQPNSGKLHVRYAAPCMSSSNHVLGNDLRTAFYRDARRVELSGSFLIRNPGLLVMMDIGLCPKAEHVLTGLTPGAYVLEWEGERYPLSLSDAPLEIVMPHPQTGEPGFWAALGGPAEQRGADKRLMEVLGPARTRTRNLGLQRDAKPVPLLYWQPWGLLDISVLVGCISGRHAYQGHDIHVVLNRRDRILDVRGSVRFLFTSLVYQAAECQDLHPHRIAFTKVQQGRYQIRQNGKPFFEVMLGERELSATRGHEEYRQK